MKHRHIRTMLVKKDYGKLNMFTTACGCHVGLGGGASAGSRSRTLWSLYILSQRMCFLYLCNIVPLEGIQGEFW